MKTHRTRRLSALSAAVLLSITLSSCASSAPEETESISQADIDKAMETPTKLVFWTWLSDINDEVELFEEQYPAIDVEVVNVGQGLEQYTKIRTALKSGEGAPDVAHIAYDTIPSFTVTGDLLDQTPYGAADLRSEFTPSVWSQVSFADGVWGLPQDAGPMANLYRTDLYTQAGITEAPKTWDEYKAAAEAIRAQTGSYISNAPTASASAWMGLFWANGARPFSFDGEQSVSINLTSPEVEEVVSYWNDLIQSDLVGTEAAFTDSWYQGLASGKYAGWLVGAWGPLFLQGTAGSTSGAWNVAPLPTQDGSPSSGNYGGSATAVLSSTKHKIAASKFAQWLNTNESSTTMLTQTQKLFPTTTALLESPDYLSAPSEFFGGQRVNEVFSEISKTVEGDFQWLPFNDYVASSFNETLGKAIANKTDLNAGLKAWQDDLVAYAKEQGFTVK